MQPSAVTIEDIHAAAARLAGQVENTPCLHSRTLSQLCGCEVYLKFENHQFTASFKERGALNKMAQLSADERARGELAASAGNHAQGVAYHAQRMGVPATIVMPRFAPAVKVENTRRFGAEVVSAGDTFDDARLHGLQLAQARALMLGHAGDAPERHFTGNRPSTTLLLPDLSPRSLGALLALYEHRTFVLGALWGINSFDQWGVELGKQHAEEIRRALECGLEDPRLDPSTRALAELLRTSKRD